MEGTEATVFILFRQTADLWGIDRTRKTKLRELHSGRNSAWKWPGREMWNKEQGCLPSLLGSESPVSGDENICVWAQGGPLPQGELFPALRGTAEGLES